jgi:hypothetical protein
MIWATRLSLILTLTPYAVRFPEKSGKLSNDFQKAGDEFTIKLTR